MRVARTPWHLLRRPRCLGSEVYRPCLPIWRRNIQTEGHDGGNEDSHSDGRKAEQLEGRKPEAKRDGVLSSGQFLAIKKKMLARPPQITRDVMSPTNSTLLNIVLADHLPLKCRDVNLNVGKVSPTHRLPEGHHLVYFPLQRTTSKLCPDGTDPYHSPGAPFDKRMWAGGSIEFNRAFLLNSAPAECREIIEDVTAKGLVGQEKIFVTVRRDYNLVSDLKDDEPPEEPRIRERRKLVFMRGLDKNQAQLKLADSISSEKKKIDFPSEPTYSVSIKPTPRLLFYYSALSFNAHLIHLNQSYCREQEGHPDLLVHGPLSLTLMLKVLKAELLRHQKNPVIRRIDYRNLAPLYVDNEMSVCVKPAHHKFTDDRSENREHHLRNWDVWIKDRNGSLSVRGTFEVEEQKDPQRIIKSQYFTYVASRR
ncbi:hypothetical protein F5B19DRAFT_298199 [Rostrohypoxylon terebratum]|nr:hypothetical protein F5B19DRAFT_298199 [Rostrohypoxylon terebratum]